MKRFFILCTNSLKFPTDLSSLTKIVRYTPRGNKKKVGIQGAI